MRTLYHYPLLPACRCARICFAEKKLKTREVVIDPWQPDEKFLGLAIEGVPPVLTDLTQTGQVTIIGTRAICEYADEASQRHMLIPGDRAQRAEIRRLCDWFDHRFDMEVNALILAEKLETSQVGGTPDTATLREGRTALRSHLEYIDWLLERRDGLAGPSFTLADISAVAALSCLDYMGEVPWRDWPNVKLWYQTIKSRPSVRPILTDRIPGLQPPPHYADLDF